MKTIPFALVMLSAVCVTMCTGEPATLRVSDNGRFLVTADGKPFFWLGDTAWALFYRLNREEAERYLADRKSKQFNVIQAVILGGSTTQSNAYGHCALLSKDPTKPNEPYFKHMDWIVNRAALLGFHVALLPTWGSNVVSPKPLFNADNARRYGEFLGRRYRDKPVIWVLGGDQNPKGFEPVWRAMADGLMAGHGGRQLMTYHPRGGASSGQWLHNEPWLAFNMIQTGHTRFRPAATDRLLLVRREYARQPAKPVLDAESVYENIPEGLSKGGKRDPFDAVPASERITDHDVRAAAYGMVFAGGFGYTYGGNGVFQMTKSNAPTSWRWTPGKTWDQALQLLGASQMQHLRALIESFPMLSRVPAPDLVDGKGCVATRDANSSYAMIYSPNGKSFKVRMNKKVKASWFDPRTGKTTVIGEFAITGRHEFTPPTNGDGNDWVLVLDDAETKSK
ncbi:MAG: DUF4038 domain-containing protein [Verrucomicrobia bacterium]|nr:DUF4038 domain-containing protein [Verrucomicrobiota bacterium]